MPIGLTKPLREGDDVALTLSFDDGSKQQAKVVVRKLGGHTEVR